MLFGVCLGGPVAWGFHSRAAFAVSPGGRRSVCPSHPPTSSAQFLIQLSFAWLSPTVLGLISGPARIFSVFCGHIYWLELAVDVWWFLWASGFHRSKAERTLHWYWRSWFWWLLEYVVDRQTVLRIPNAPRAFLTLSATSPSAPLLSLLIMLPRQRNSDTCSVCWSLRSGWLMGVWMRISFVLLIMIFARFGETY